MSCLVSCHFFQRVNELWWFCCTMICCSLQVLESYKSKLMYSSFFFFQEMCRKPFTFVCGIKLISFSKISIYTCEDLPKKKMSDTFFIAICKICRLIKWQVSNGKNNCDTTGTLSSTIVWSECRTLSMCMVMSILEHHQDWSSLHWLWVIWQLQQSSALFCFFFKFGFVFLFSACFFFF